MLHAWVYAKPLGIEIRACFLFFSIADNVKIEEYESITERDESGPISVQSGSVQ